MCTGKPSQCMTNINDVNSAFYPSIVGNQVPASVRGYGVMHSPVSGGRCDPIVPYAR